jgi:peroxiredoxin
MLKSGEYAVPFEVRDYKGQRITLYNAEQDYILLSFLRSADCPFCNLRVLELLNYEDQLSESDITTYLFFHSDQKTLLRNMGNLRPTESFKMIPDPDLEVHKLYQTQINYLGTMKTFLRFSKLLETITKRVFNLRSIADPPLIPADFVVGPTGILLDCYYGDDYADNLDLERVIDLVNKDKH